MKRTDKKGFTIVELVIVIAVIAILAAVLIPNISKLVQKANTSADESLVRNLNTALSMDVEKHTTMSAALKAAKDNGGYDLETIELKGKGNKILWDSVNDCFVYLKGTDRVYLPNTQSVKKAADMKPYEYFEILSERPSSFADREYSIYAAWTAEEGETVTGLKVGFDAGKNKFASIAFALDANEEKTVTINTASGKLTIDAAKGVVNHYGDAAEVVITKIDNASYHEFGTVNTLTVKQGHVEIGANATVNSVIVEKATNATISLDNKGTVNTVAGASDLDTVSGIKEEAKIETKTTLTADGGFVKLSENQTISTAFTFSKLTVLDLNGKTLTISSTGYIPVTGQLTIIDSVGTGKIITNQRFDIKNGGIFTFNGGTYESDEYAFMVSGDCSYNQSNPVSSTLVINGGNITPKGDYGIFIRGKGASLKVNGGTLVATIAISGNGGKNQAKNYYYGGTNIEINGGKIISESYTALYLPQNGICIINGGYIKGSDCVSMKSGRLVINGGTLHATGAYIGDPTDSGNGYVATGSALTIASNDRYDGNMSVEILGGIFKADKSYAICEQIPKSLADQHKDVATHSTVISIVISGGSFSGGSDVQKAIYIAEAFDKLVIDNQYSESVKKGK